MKMRYIYILLGLAFALPVLADMNYELVPDAILPVAKFQNTGALNASGSSYPSIAMIDEYGYAYFGNSSATPEHVLRRAGSGTPGTPSTPGTGGVQQPVGDAVLPLLLMAAMLGVWRTWRRRKEMMA